MKKITILTIALLAFAVSTASSQKAGIISDVLKKSAEDKVTNMQKLIGFDDEQAKRLTDLEFKFLTDVQKAEHCCWCNKKKRIERLKKNRDAELQQILTREQYIKYDAVESGRIVSYPELCLHQKANTL